MEWSATAAGYDVRPASEGIVSNSGPLHALVDADPVPVDDRIPEDARHVHFGDGSIGSSLDLADRLGDEYEAGDHLLVFQMGTATHRATPLTAETTVTTE